MDLHLASSVAGLCWHGLVLNSKACIFSCHSDRCHVASKATCSCCPKWHNILVLRENGGRGVGEIRVLLKYDKMMPILPLHFIYRLKFIESTSVYSNFSLIADWFPTWLSLLNETLKVYWIQTDLYWIFEFSLWVNIEQMSCDIKVMMCYQSFD